MKTGRWYSNILVVAIVILLVGTNLKGQSPFDHRPSFGSSHAMKRMIIMEPKKKPVLFRINEGQVRNILVAGDSLLRRVKITRIWKDSIYLDGKGHRFGEVTGMQVKEHPFNPVFYSKTDSSSWRLFFPPDSVYESRWVYSGYMHWVEGIRKRDKFESHAPPFTNNIFKFNFSKLANLEIAFSYEVRITKEWSCEVETGYQFEAGSQKRDDFFMGLYPLFKYSGFSYITGPKYYFNSRGYIEPLIHYRYLEMSRARSKSPEQSGYVLQSQFRNDAGFSVRVGQLIWTGDMILEGYFGLGVKLVYIRQYADGWYLYDDSSNYFRWYNEDHSPKVENIRQLWPVIGLGMKLGFGF
jgi:hypothetical protein